MAVDACYIDSISGSVKNNFVLNAEEVRLLLFQQY